MSAQETAAQLTRLAQSLAAEAPRLTPAEAQAVQRQVGDALAALAGTVCGLATACAGSSGSAAAPAHSFATTAAVEDPPAPAPTPTFTAPAAGSSGGGLKISLGGGSAGSGSTSGGRAPGGITLSGGAPSGTGTGSASSGSSGSSGSGGSGGGRSGLEVAKGLSKFKDFIEKNQIAVPAGDLAFTAKAVSIIESLPEAERGSSKVAKLLGDCIGFIDKILAECFAEGAEDIVQAGNAVQKEIADFLHDHGIQVVPVPGEGVQAAVNAGAETIETFHSAAKGTPLMVARHGLKVNGSAALKPAVLVSSGESSELGRAIVGGMAALVKPHGSKAAEAKLRAQSLKELRNLTRQLAGADDEKQRQVCQYAINALHNSNPDKSLDAVEGKLVDFLKASGYSEIYVGIGQKFDESYSPSKYERRKLSSDRELGTILGVQQRGFLNKSGVPVQKAIVLVSG